MTNIEITGILLIIGVFFFYKKYKYLLWSNKTIVNKQLYNSTLTIPFKVFHKALEDVLSRNVTTSEMSNTSKLIEEYENSST